MKEILLQILVIAYASVGIITLLGYMPTIKDLYHRKKMSANIFSYAIWTFCAAVAFLYSIFILPDLLFIIVSGLGFIGCAIVLLLALSLKYRK
ncbi:MAG: hypothetical protein WC852_01960 [Candidatus Nanoarchaeia archaeon]|jgi:hypothetical protein